MYPARTRLQQNAVELPSSKFAQITFHSTKFTSAFSRFQSHLSLLDEASSQRGASYPEYVALISFEDGLWKLTFVVERSLAYAAGDNDVPYLVTMCTQAIEDRFLEEQGIYRQSGYSTTFICIFFIFWMTIHPSVKILWSRNCAIASSPDPGSKTWFIIHFLQQFSKTASVTPVAGMLGRLRNFRMLEAVLA